MKLLTVTVPCYNSQDYMQKCIDSLLPGGDRVEIIIIDDGSTDRTAEIADTYAEQYPGIVRVIHQENGGHGEGINQGLRHATGKYFKVVDSDDCVSEDFPTFLNALETCDVDLVVTNYHYVHSDGIGDRSITYGNALRKGRMLTWNQTRPLLLHQMLTIHSCTFRTECMRRSGLDLPKHTFYEDNLMVCSVLPYVETLYYLDMDLYLYTIGREGQSMQEDILRRRYTHQLLVAQRGFAAFSQACPKNLMHKIYLHHEIFMLFAMGSSVTRLNNSQEADEKLWEMWENCQSIQPKKAGHFRYRTPLLLMNLPGQSGRRVSRTVYCLARKIVRFN